MNDARLDALTQDMMSMAREIKRIDEEQYRCMFDAVAEVIAGTSAEFDALTAFDSPSFKSFETTFEDAFVFDRADEQKGFMEGACWAIAGIMGAAANQMQQRLQMKSVAKNAKSHHGLLREIEKRPGIVQSELGRLLGKGKSNLSQIVARLEAEGLINVLAQGRFHYLYLSSTGKAALRLLEESIGEDELQEAPADGSSAISKQWNNNDQQNTALADDIEAALIDTVESITSLWPQSATPANDSAYASSIQNRDEAFFAASRTMHNTNYAAPWSKQQYESSYVREPGFKQAS